MTRFFIRELQKIDPSEEPGVFDVLAVCDDGYRYSPDVYYSYADAEAAIEVFVSEDEPLEDWEITHHPGIQIPEATGG